MHHDIKKLMREKLHLFFFFFLIWWRLYIDRSLIHNILSFRAKIHIVTILLVLYGIYFKSISMWGRITFNFLSWNQRNMHLIISFHFVSSVTYILGSSLPRIKVVPQGNKIGAPGVWEVNIRTFTSHTSKFLLGIYFKTLKIK